MLSPHCILSKVDEKMSFVIKVVTYSNHRPSPPIEATWQHKIFKIGRHEKNDLFLYDTSLEISREHAFIEQHGTKFILYDKSANGTTVNDSIELQNGEQRELHDGDQIQVGDYLCEFQLKHQSQETDDTPPLDEETSEYIDWDTDPDYKMPNPMLDPPPTQPQTHHHTIPPTLVNAFLKELGLESPPMSDQETQQMMIDSAALLRQFVHGAVHTLQLRKDIRSAIRVNQTMLSANPLKMAPTADEALKMLMFPPVQSYQSPLDAINETFKDIQSHEVELFNNIRAGIHAVLTKLDPDKLEQQLGKNVIDKLVPRIFQSECWALFKKNHKQVAENAEFDFHTFLQSETNDASTQSIDINHYPIDLSHE